MKRHGFAFLEMAVPIAIAIVVISAFIVYLLTHSNNAKFKPMYVKSMSTLNQAASMARVQPGYVFSEMDSSCPEDIETTHELNSEDHSICAILDATLKDATIQGKVSDLKYKYKEKLQKYSIKTDLLGDYYRDYLVYAFKDGSYLAINKNAKNCELPIAQPIYNEETGELFKSETIDLLQCVGFVDLNGSLPPNKEAYCSSGENMMTDNNECVVDMRQNNITDVYPIIFYNAQVVPLTAAAKKAFLASKAK